MSPRAGAIINANLGLQAFTTEPAEEFVAQAVQWSKRLPELAELRAILRSGTIVAPLCQPHGTMAGSGLAYDVAKIVRRKARAKFQCLRRPMEIRAFARDRQFMDPVSDAAGQFVCCSTAWV